MLGCSCLLGGCGVFGGGSGSGSGSGSGRFIDYMYVDEAKDQLHIIAGPNTRFLTPNVFIGGVNLPVISWTASEIIATIDRAGANSAGLVQVDSDNGS